MVKKIRLFWFPFAGGHAASYRGITRLLAPDIESVLLELPGHGTRIKERLATDMDTLVSDMLTKIRPHTDMPYAFFGHSMGAVLAWRCAQTLRDEKKVLPVHIFASGRSAPSGPPDDRGRYKLPHDEFIQMLRDLGGTPPEVLEHAELMELMIPMLRADFQVIETYSYQPAEALPVPMTVMYGRQDSVSGSEAAAWQSETTSALQVQDFPGGHFFIFDDADRIARTISATLLHPAGA